MSAHGELCECGDPECRPNPPLPRCELCRSLHTYRVEPTCACGNLHRVCDRCYARWGLGTTDWPVTRRRFLLCPASDEFRAAFALGGG